LSFNNRVLRVLPQIYIIIGVVVISQAASFARPHDQDSLLQLITADKLQAALLFGLGVGCFLQSVIFRGLTQRLDEQERMLLSLLPKQGDADA